MGEKTNTIIGVDGDTIRLEVGGVLRPGVRWLKLNGSRYEWLRNVYVDPETAEPLSDQYYDNDNEDYEGALRFDASQRAAGESWTETYRKTSIEVANCPGWDESLGRENLVECPDDAIETEAVIETWTVVAADEQLSTVQRNLEPSREVEGVPAGDFEVLCQERSCDADACTSGVYCFSRGVGKVYELSSEREELSSVCF